MVLPGDMIWLDTSFFDEERGVRYDLDITNSDLPLGGPALVVGVLDHVTLVLYYSELVKVPDRNVSDYIKPWQPELGSTNRAEA
jgi:hypothetical protein